MARRNLRSLHVHAPVGALYYFSGFWRHLQFFVFSIGFFAKPNKVTALGMTILLRLE